MSHSLGSLFCAFVLLHSACAPAGSAEILPEMRLGRALVENHKGPPVKIAATGTYPFVQALLEVFDKEAASDLTVFTDGYYREPGNEGYNAVMRRIEEDLRAAGFGSTAGLELELLEKPMRHKAWTPRSASIELRSEDMREVLLQFDAEDDLARTMIPSYGPSCDVQGKICLSLDELEAGQILVTKQSLGRVLRAAKRKQAAAVFSCWLSDFCIDPTGEERHKGAIHYGKVRAGTELPVAHISPLVYERIAKASADKGAQLHYKAEVDWSESPVKTLIARILGSEHPDQCVAVAAHVQEPGANDNASGVAGLVVGANALAGLLASRSIEFPKRTLVMIWGDEMNMTRTFLGHTQREVIAGFSSDMTGPSVERTGAICLLERCPDPGSLVTLPPDEHTPWGAGEVKAEDLQPNGLSIIARCALSDVALIEGDWQSADHPWEGGSDHDVFLDKGIPAVLLWHFTDFAYHTNLDRLEHFDVEELRRTSAALLGAAMAIAAPRPADLDRYLDSLQLARRVRLSAAEEVGNTQLAEQWREWFTGARHWLRSLCLDVPSQNSVEKSVDAPSQEKAEEENDD